MAFSMAGGGPSHPQINVTPLIDVLLVLIIVFMVVVSLSQQKGLEAQVPQPAEDQNSPPAPDRTIVIQIAWNTADQPPLLKINQETVKWEDLQKRLHDIYKLRAERVAFVRGDDDIDFQYVAEVIDIAREAGVDRVGLLTRRQELAGE
jgi:biopolymer transport protein TolR